MSADARTFTAGEALWIAQELARDPDLREAWLAHARERIAAAQPGETEALILYARREDPDARAAAALLYAPEQPKKS